ncbi:DUF6114 domain-containing protein [Actinoplanes sp. L3-i22]|uniref:DUF6114 domain-containing protein n=1 Tax=Actinoplanes sp. L3-i22 TaxID=2836373 RepID=UPI001C783AFF|nr:DUF6114 domain-containing protein [Actinoplanes sp. L3-i22]BCY07838.1 hypothetical protein L3i22_029260 [Actinoplanes sp. L3-i22]
MATDDFWSKFRRWRRARPFWGGLFLLLSGVEFFWSSNMDMANIQIHIGPQGFLSYLLPVLMLICGVLVWFTPQQRVFYGIIGLLAALYSFIGLNLGGWFLGMILGIVGGALSLSWTPQAPRPDVRLPGPTGFSGPPQYAPEGESTQQIEVAGHDDRPHETPPAVSDPSILPGFGAAPAREDGPASGAAHTEIRSFGAAGQTTAAADEPRGDLPGPRRGLNRKALAIIMVPAVVGTTVLIGSRIPASADDCPAGLPSISSSASSSPAATSSVAAKSKITAKPTGTRTGTAAAGATKGAAATASASPTASATADAGNPILEGLQNVVDGVGNLLGIGDDESATPSASPTTSATTEPTAEPTATTTTTAPAGGDATPTASGTATPTKTTTSSAAAADEDVIPCLGARQEGLVADGGIPKSSIKPGIMKVDSLTMYNSTYEGVADVPTQNGVLKSLQFNMDKAVNKPFSLTIDEPGDATTTIKSAELTTTGHVRFYTPKMTGNLFGLIPVTFTPEQPPPLTLPILWFTDVTIELANVSCDTLTASPIQILES